MARRREIRTALVIGNSAYRNEPALQSPVHDAHAVSAALRRLKFHVRDASDLGREAMAETFHAFEEDMKEADVALLYYSGHGLQINGVNYLVPVDAKLASEGEIDQLISLQDWIDRMPESARAKLVLLDACRDNPFARRYEEIVHHAKGIYIAAEETPVPIPVTVDARLAKIESARDTFVAFATAPDAFAFAATPISRSNLSPFTESLLRHIETTDLALTTLTIRVRNEVRKLTGGRQTTWDHSSLGATFFFNPGSLIWLAGNMIGLFALITAMTPYSFTLAAGESLRWVLPGLAIAIVTLGLFLAGLQRAYKNLRGELDPDRNDDGRGPRSAFWSALRRGLFGGFFGGIIAAPIITAGYYFGWDPAYVATRPSFGLLLTENTVAAVLVGLVLGACGLALAEAFARLGSSGPRWRRVAFNALTGAIVGGILAGVITAPLETVYFGPKPRPFLSPVAMLPGALIGTAVIVFSIVNYRLEHINPKRLILSAVTAIGSCFATAVVAFGVLLFLLPQVLMAIAVRITSEIVTIPNLLIGGFFYGIVVGAILGAAMGLTLILTPRPDRHITL